MLAHPTRCLTGKTVLPRCLCSCGVLDKIPYHRQFSTSHVYLKVSRRSELPSATSRRLKNTEFVKRWNQENLNLFGPKLKVSKKTLQKRAAAAEINIDDAAFVDYATAGTSEIPKVTDEQLLQVEKSTVHSETTKKARISRKPTSKSPLSVATPTQSPAVELSELDGILRFPLFLPDINTLQQNMSMSLVTTDIPALHDQKPVRVTRVLDQTKSEQSQFILNRWIKEQIQLLGKEGFGAAQKKRMAVASGLHGCLEQYLLGTPEHLLNIDEHIEPYWTSIQGALSNIDEVLGVEVKLEHKELKYIGTADCIAKYKGELCVIDWKTSGKPKPSLGDLFDYPMQVAAYLGALQFNPTSDVADAAKEVDNLLIIVSYEDGSPAHAHYIPRRQVLKYWGEWTRRLHQYWTSVLSQQSATGSKASQHSA